MMQEKLEAFGGKFCFNQQVKIVGLVRKLAKNSNNVNNSKFVEKFLNKRFCAYFEYFDLIDYRLELT